eukprot:scaffold229468_cov36-Cyclotella_meneghiniana.AAC.2
MLDCQYPEFDTKRMSVNRFISSRRNDISQRRNVIVVLIHEIRSCSSLTIDDITYLTADGWVGVIG